ncbi:MAG: DUF262 domain-containing protein [Candidatus Eremiobacteraeota bacterium]|nr:DUF262 domain-containing protein [Candidatus Eremiobacteraeota bacterium]
MEFKPEVRTAKQLVDAWANNNLRRNPEYQRGGAWSLPQKQALIDSLFRRYPVPPLFVEERRAKPLFGDETVAFDIIDGQQRILALSSFFNDEFPLLATDDKRLRIPHSLRSLDAPWAGRKYTQLEQKLKQELDGAELNVYLVKDVKNADEIRDLFIRLQSGTALTRQQIRDAWPGSITAIVSSFSGKLQVQPTYRIFQAIDGRGTRDDEDDPRDPYVQHRQSCAQLLRILLARYSNPVHFPSVNADEIDAFYHEFTNFSTDSETYRQIQALFHQAQSVTDELRGREIGRKKVSKLSLFSLVLFLQDVSKMEHYRLKPGWQVVLASHLANPNVATQGRAVSGPTITKYYEEWRNKLPSDLGVSLDHRRVFSNEQKQAIWKKCGPICGECNQEMNFADAEFDHHPKQFYLGGRTEVENGRPVHRQCHARGRPLA